MSSSENGARRITRYTSMDALPEFLTPAEVQAFLALGRSSVYELIRSGQLPAVRFGRILRVPRSALSPGEPRR